MRRLVVVPVLWFFGAGCAGEVTTDPNEVGAIASPPVAEFDPAAQVVPLPNNLLLDPATHKLTLPPQCGEAPGSPAATLRAELNQLDGFGTSKVSVTATFSEPVDVSSLSGRVFLVRLATDGMPSDGRDGPVPVDVSVGMTARASADCSTMTPVDDIILQPKAPLAAKSTYGVVLLAGIKTASGAEFLPTANWALVRQPAEPVQISSAGVVTSNATPFDPTNPTDLATIQGLDQLWRAHAPVLQFFDMALPSLTGTNMPVGRDRILLAWSFDTQTISDPFDPAIMGSPASELISDTAPDAPTMPPTPTAGDGAPISVKEFYALALPAVSDCNLVGCGAIGSIYLGVPALQLPSPTYVSPSFQTKETCDPKNPVVAGPWSDPIEPTKVCDQQIPFVAVIPNASPGPAGFKTVIFGHGLTRSKEDLLAIAGTLASKGIASVAIDAVDHGERAVPISTDAALGCDPTTAVGMDKPCTTTFGPTCAPQCFAPILTTDLAVTRDNLRQTVLDQLKLERVLQYCATENACGKLWVDASHIGYIGQSLGSLIGAVTVAVSPSVKTAVLDVGAADWVQIFTDTATPAIRCPILDALIDGGILTGTKWGPDQNPMALCLDPNAAWKSDPRFVQFAQSARWLLDPVDGVNYAAAYRAGSGPTPLLQEVIGDQVIPNSATEEFGGLLGLMPSPAVLNVTAPPAVPTPTPAALMTGGQWIQYKNIPPDATMAFPGNSYAHGSLLQPVTTPSLASGALGTALMQTDSLTYLATHL